MAVDPGAVLGLEQPLVTRVSGNGTNALSYKLAPGETMRIEAIAVDADATAAAGGTISAEFLAPSGETVAESSSSAQIVGGTVSEATFAPFLPDTSVVGSVAGESQLQTGLVLTELPGDSTVTIVATDPLVKLTGARIWATGGPGIDTAEPPPLQPVYVLRATPDTTAGLV